MVVVSLVVQARNGLDSPLWKLCFINSFDRFLDYGGAWMEFDLVPPVRVILDSPDRTPIRMFELLGYTGALFRLM